MNLIRRMRFKMLILCNVISLFFFFFCKYVIKYTYLYVHLLINTNETYIIYSLLKDKNISNIIIFHINIPC